MKEHKPDAIGLSGLLVKSAQMMVVTAEDLTAAGVRLPVLVGGAALSPRFTAKRIARAYDGPVFYAKDAMGGLSHRQRLLRREARRPAAKNREVQDYLRTETPDGRRHRRRRGGGDAAVVITHDGSTPTPPDLKLHVVNDFDVREIFKYVNPIMLYGKHLGLRGNLEQHLKDKNPKAVELYRRVNELQDEILLKKDDLGEGRV